MQAKRPQITTNKKEGKKMNDKAIMDLLRREGQLEKYLELKKLFDKIIEMHKTGKYVFSLNDGEYFSEPYIDGYNLYFCDGTFTDTMADFCIEGGEEYWEISSVDYVRGYVQVFIKETIEL